MKKTIFFIFIFVLITGCVSKQIVDEIQLISSASFDYVEDNKIKGTAAISIHKWNEQIENETISAIAKTSKDISFLLNTKSAKPLHPGKLNTLLFSEKLAKNVPLMELIDTFMRNPAIGRRLFVAITEGEASEIYNVPKTLEKDIALDIQRMIEQNIKEQNIPKSNLHLFLKQNYQPGQTPYLPYLRKNQDIVQIDGVALLKDGHFLHKINLRQSFMLKLLVERFSNGTIEFELPEGEFAVVRNIEAYAKFDIEKNTNEPNIEVRIFFDGTINEYTGKVINDETLKEMNQALRETITEEANELIQLFQKLEVDPIGIGNRVKSRNRHFDAEQWNIYYKDAKIDVSTDVIIKGHGISQ